MKGIIFNLLEDVVDKNFGEETWDQLLDATGLDGVFTSLGNYPDETFFKLVHAASDCLNKSPGEIVRWFGMEAIPLLAAKYPVFFTKHKSTKPFILTLNAIIHPEVRKLYPGADVPDFDFEDSDPNVLVMGYHSKRKLCSLAEGLIEGASLYFNELVSIRHPLCMLRGDPSCRLELSFVPKPPA